ncbi:MAG TPA: hypothetical protein VHX18_11330 [Rhizomicrobium sp.]|nr:hypothetical protein [Rhizomicrobium sp.]
MPTPFEPETADAVFTPLAGDGIFDADIARYLSELGQARPCVVLAFPPKAAGTYLRSAAISALGGQLVRTVQAQGGRDATFYLPTFLLYYTKAIPARPLVTHVHMQALAANRHFIEALDLRPVVMIRALPDMLASYLDELEDQPLRPDKWLNIRVPGGYPGFSAERKGDFIIEMMVPWYVSFFSTWLDYARTDARVLFLDYDEFRADPAADLEKLLAHSRLPRSRQQCQAALDEVWEERAIFRYNKGISGRGRERFTRAQMDRLRRLIGYYADLGSDRGQAYSAALSLLGADTVSIDLHRLIPY